MPSDAGPPGQRDQRHRALAQRDRLGGVADVEHVGRAAGVRGVHVAELESQVVGHRQRSEPGRVARAEVAVDVVLGEPGVRERAPRDLGVELGDRLVVRLARGVLERADDVGLALDGHRRAVLSSSPLGLTTWSRVPGVPEWSHGSPGPGVEGPPPRSSPSGTTPRRATRARPPTIARRTARGEGRQPSDGGRGRRRAGATSATRGRPGASTLPPRGRPRPSWHRPPGGAQ